MADVRKIPVSELDLQLIMNDPVWGKEATSELIQRLGSISSFVVAIDGEGKIYSDDEGKPQVFLITDEGKLVNSKGEVLTDSNNNEVVLRIKQSLWGLLSYYTKDMRLGNLDQSDYVRAVYYLDLAGDCLRDGYTSAFMACIQRVITVLELSQSKKGFLRKAMGTIRQENITGEMEPKKTSILGGKK